MNGLEVFSFRFNSNIRTLLHGLRVSRTPEINFGSGIFVLLIYGLLLISQIFFILIAFVQNYNFPTFSRFWVNCNPLS